MRTHIFRTSKTFCALSGIFLLLIALSACGGGVLGLGAAPTPTPTPKPRTPQELIVDAQKSMSELKSVHSVNTTGGKGQAKDAGKSVPFSLTAVTTTDSKGTNEANLTDNISMQASTVSENMNTGAVVDNNKLYIKDQQGKWFVTDRPSDINEVPGGIASGLYEAIMDGQITDKGHEKLDGLSLRHVNASLPRATLDDIASSIGGETSGVGDLVDNVSDVQADMWIDETTNYVHRMTISYTASIAIPGLDDFDMPMTIDTKYSQFNKLVTITVPTNPTSVSSVDQALGNN